MSESVNTLRGSAKAIVAAIAPIVTVLVSDLIADLETWVLGAVASGVTSILVWLKSNDT